MNDKDNDNEALRAAWKSDVQRHAQGQECPDEETIFDAVAGQLDPSACRAIILHTARCGACAESWRVALALQRSRDNVSRPRAFASLPAVWAAAAAVCLALGVWWIMPQLDFGTEGPGAPSVLRDIATSDEFTLHTSGQFPTHQALRLEWSGPPDAIQYRVHLNDSRLQTVFLARTTANEVLVPADRLQDLAAGEELFWYVIAHFEDGSERQSPTGTLSLIDVDQP